MGLAVKVGSSLPEVKRKAIPEVKGRLIGLVGKWGLRGWGTQRRRLDKPCTKVIHGGGDVHSLYNHCRSPVYNLLTTGLLMLPISRNILKDTCQALDVVK